MYAHRFLTGCRIPVVRMLWEHVDWVQFPAPRPIVLLIKYMSKSLQELQQIMVEQLKRKGFYPKDEKEVLLRLGEEVGEVMEAVRENQSLQDLSHEMVDVFWNILRLAELKNIDMEKAFLEKVDKNEKRPLPKEVTDISENC